MFHVEPSSRGAEQHSNLDGQPAWIPPITISSRTEHGLLVANSLPSMERRVWWVLCSDVSRGTFLAGCGAAFQSRRSASVDSTNYDQLPHGARVAGGELPAIDGAACLVGAVLRCFTWNLPRGVRSSIPISTVSQRGFHQLRSAPARSTVAGGELPAIDGAACLVGAVLRCFTWNLPRGVRSSIPISTVSQRGFHQLRSAPARSTGCWWRTPCHRWSGVSGGCCAPMFHVEPSSRVRSSIPISTVSQRGFHQLRSAPARSTGCWWRTPCHRWSGVSGGCCAPMFHVEHPHI